MIEACAKFMPCGRYRWEVPGYYQAMMITGVVSPRSQDTGAGGNGFG